MRPANLRRSRAALCDRNALVTDQGREPMLELILAGHPTRRPGIGAVPATVFDNICAADLQRDEVVQGVGYPVCVSDVVAFQDPICAGAIPVAELSRSRAADRCRIGRRDRSWRERRVGIGDGLLRPGRRSQCADERQQYEVRTIKAAARLESRARRRF